MPVAMPALLNRLFVDDCLSGMAMVPDASIDMVLCDLPYGTTQCRWDAVIPFEPLWAAYRRIIKPHGVIVLTASQPFTSVLVSSNLAMFRYSWVWEKSKATGYLNAKKRPLVAHEDVLVFSHKAPRYFPQMTEGTPYFKGKALRSTDVYGAQRAVLIKNDDGKRYPRTVQYFKTAESEGKVVHPTQKPVNLFEYLVRTYTVPGEVVLDNCMGSGTTGIACLRLGRNFVGFESDHHYAALAAERIAIAKPGFGRLSDGAYGFADAAIAARHRLRQRTNSDRDYAAHSTLAEVATPPFCHSAGALALPVLRQHSARIC